MPPRSWFHLQGDVTTSAQGDECDEYVGKVRHRNALSTIRDWPYIPQEPCIKLLPDPCEGACAVRRMQVDGKDSPAPSDCPTIHSYRTCQ